MTSFSKPSAVHLRSWLIVVFIYSISATVLASFGRSLWCPASDWAYWSFDVNSQHNSQHLVDWYTPSHISHGLLFALLFLRVLGWRLAAAFPAALALEAGWEVLENSTIVIERYRHATLALNYFGDSILNSLADITWCGAGFLIASCLSSRQVFLLFAVFELLTLYLIRDNLTLNVIMLLYPVEAIKEWQLAAPL
ncbi:MAG: DUF2585 family protein [Bdellovibrionales bacterium]|nr:DUF2585 family protein [Bdellovibrionales bacterium]